MALSKKAQVNIKLETAVKALSDSLKLVSEKLEGKQFEEIRDDAELYRLFLLKKNYEVQIANVYKLFESNGKKQSARLILAFCTGTLKDGEPCDYKIRASMSTYLRGVPCCPDVMCNRKSKPFEIEIKDKEIDQELDGALGGKEIMEMEVDHAKLQKERDVKRAVRNNMRGFVLPHDAVAGEQKCIHGTPVGTFCAECKDDEDWLVGKVK